MCGVCICMYIIVCLFIQVANQQHLYVANSSYIKFDINDAILFLAIAIH